MADPVEEQKRAAALEAVRAEVRDGMIVGLGTGSTARFATEEVARLAREEGWSLRGVPSSEATAQLARSLGLALTDLSATPDVAIDGADEIDPRRDLIKGAGGAMTRERCVAVAARRFVVVADASKLVPRLRRPVPIEALTFALPLVTRLLRERLPGSDPVPRLDNGAPAISDNGNPLLDVAWPGAFSPEEAAATIAGIPGVVAHGFFLGMQPPAYVAGPDGVRVLD